MARKKEDYVDTFWVEGGSALNVANNTYKRNWFLCINEGAQCYSDFADRVQSIGFDTDRWVHYAYIMHDKDSISEVGYNRLLDDSCNNNNQSLFDRLNGYQILPVDERTKERYAFKPRHYHLLICFQDAKSWSRIKNLFPGAHLQACNSVGLCFKYLTHQTDDCIKKGKVQYDPQEIVMDSTGYDFFVNVPYCSKFFEVFDPSMIGKYVFIDGLNDIVDFYERFSPVQVQRWRTACLDYCNVKRFLMDNSFGEYVYYWTEANENDKNGLSFEKFDSKHVLSQQKVNSDIENRIHLLLN